MNFVTKKGKYQFLLALCGIIWIIFLMKILQIDSQSYIFPDSDNYRESARMWYFEHKVHYYRPLFMAIISGIPYLFGADDAPVYQFSFYINVFSWIGTAILLFSFVKKYVNNKTAFLVSLCYYTFFGIALLNFHLLTENIFTFLSLLSFFLIDQYNIKQKFYYLSLAICILLLLILIKPSITFFSFFVLLYYSKAIWNNLKSRYMFFILLGVFSLISQNILMKKQFGNYTVSYIDGVTYYNYLGAKATAYKENISFDEAYNKRAHTMETLTFSQQKQYALHDFLEQLTSNKLNLAKAYLSNTIDNTKSASGSITIYSNVNQNAYHNTVQQIFIFLSKYQNRFLTIVGFLLALYFTKKYYTTNTVYTLMALYILYTIVVSGVSCTQGDRFHIVFFSITWLFVIKYFKENNIFIKSCL